MKYPDHPLNEFLTAMASRKPIPGGGSAAALAGGSAAALLAMTCRITDTESSRTVIVEVETIRHRLEQLIDEDANAYSDFLKAAANEKEDALKKAALIPLETATLCFRVLELTGEIIRICRKSVLTDAGTAALLAEAAIYAAYFNTAVNLKSIEDSHFRETVNTKLKGFTSSSTKRRTIIDYVNRQL